MAVNKRGVAVTTHPIQQQRGQRESRVTLYLHSSSPTSCHHGVLQSKLIFGVSATVCCEYGNASFVSVQVRVFLGQLNGYPFLKKFFFFLKLLTLFQLTGWFLVTYNRQSGMPPFVLHTHSLQCVCLRLIRKIAKNYYQPRHICHYVFPSVRPSAWNNSPPTGGNFIKFYI